MTAQVETLMRLKDTWVVYLQHSRNLEQSILDKTGTFLCENEKKNIWITRIKKQILEDLEKIKGLDEKLLEPLPQKDSKSELQDILMCEDSNFKIIAKIDRCLSKITLVWSLNLLSILNRPPSVSQDAEVKLPKPELLKFDGHINWREFWDQVNLATPENKTIAEIDKFIYLKSFQANLALSAISGLSLNSTKMF